MEFTGSSVSIRNDAFSWLFSAERFWPKYLRELAVVKASVRRNLPRVEGMPWARLKQYRVERLQFPGASGRVKAVELDLSCAYLTAAQILGLIDQAVFVRLAGLRKSWRLRVLGAIAVSRQVMEFDADGLIVGRRRVEDPDMRRCWWLICGMVDNVLTQTAQALADTFLYYWYDNLFMLPTGQERLRTIDLSDFRFTLDDCWLDYRWKEGNLYITVNGRRPFVLPCRVGAPGAAEAFLDRQRAEYGGPGKLLSYEGLDRRRKLTDNRP
jgi:hypothetical protein